jgi:hypothetical protein
MCSKWSDLNFSVGGNRFFWLSAPGTASAVSATANQLIIAETRVCSMTCQKNVEALVWANVWHGNLFYCFELSVLLNQALKGLFQQR